MMKFLFFQIILYNVNINIKNLEDQDIIEDLKKILR